MKLIFQGEPVQITELDRWEIELSEREMRELIKYGRELLVGKPGHSVYRIALLLDAEKP